MRRSIIAVSLLAALAAVGCSASSSDDAVGDDTAEAIRSPGPKATDARVPELGADPKIVQQSKVSMGDALKASDAKCGPTIEAKFELGDDGKLSLSIYPAGKPLAMDAEPTSSRSSRAIPRPHRSTASSARSRTRSTSRALREISRWSS